MKPIKTAFGREIIFGGEGEIGKLNRDQNTRVGSLYSCGVPGSGREQLHGTEPVVDFSPNVP